MSRFAQHIIFNAGRATPLTHAALESTQSVQSLQHAQQVLNKKPQQAQSAWVQAKARSGRLQRAGCALTLGWTLMLAAWTPAAHAQGIPTYDNANFIQAIQQILSWQQQYEQMYQQLTHQFQQIELAEQQLKSLNGQRLLGMVENSIRKSVVDPEFRDKLKAARTRQGANRLVQQQLRKIVESTQERFAQVQRLMAQINATVDQKSATEIVARIQAEQAMISNESKEAQVLEQELQARLREIDYNHLRRQIDSARQPLRG